MGYFSQANLVREDHTGHYGWCGLPLFQLRQAVY